MVAGAVAGPGEVKCGLSWRTRLRTRNSPGAFRFLPRLLRARPGGGAEEAPGPAVETKGRAPRAGPRSGRGGRAPAGRAESAHAPASGLSPGLVPSFRWSPGRCHKGAGPTAAAPVTPEVLFILLSTLQIQLPSFLQSLACRWHRSPASVLRNVLLPWFMAFGSEQSC